MVLVFVLVFDFMLFSLSFRIHRFIFVRTLNIIKAGSRVLCIMFCSVVVVLWNCMRFSLLLYCVYCMQVKFVCIQWIVVDYRLSGDIGWQRNVSIGAQSLSTNKIQHCPFHLNFHPPGTIIRKWLFIHFNEKQ